MDRASYLRDIEALVQHLRPQAQLLGDMDLHVIEELYDAGVPLDAALAGIRQGAERLGRLKRPPRGLPLSRMRKDVERAMGRGRGSAPPRTPTPNPELPAEPPPEADDSWRDLLRELSARVEGDACTLLRELAGTSGLGEERAFVRFVAISRDHYQRRLDSLDPDERDALIEEVEASSAAVLGGMSADAREDLIAELVRRRLMAQDPVLDPRRFWQD